MSDRTNARKLEHIDIIRRDAEVDRRKVYFDDIHLIHRALPELDLAAVDPSTMFLGKPLSFPLLISCMTGGDHDMVRSINRNLAVAAESTGVAMGVGSQRVMFTHPEAKESFALRKAAPSTVLLANLGAVQFNLGFGLAEARAAVSVLDADALVLHLNPLQEAVQPEGDTNFSGLGSKISDIASGVGCPVILKEVGSGMSPADAEIALAAGVSMLDIAGSGGTSWSRIEHHRHAGQDPDSLGIRFQDWGVPTPYALASLAPYRDRLTLIASGGVRTGLDMVKAVILGASLCGLASPFLAPAMDSADAVIAEIERLRREFITAMFLLGVESIDRLTGREDLIRKAWP